MKELYLIYDPQNGPTVPDGKIEEWWLFASTADSMTFTAGSDSMLLRALLGFAEGDVDKLTYVYNSKYYKIPETAIIPYEFPKVLDFRMDWAFRLMKTRANLATKGN